MFITTANTLYNIPPTLLDRLEIIRFSGYTLEEKVKIAQKFLVPKQLKEHGLSADELQVSEETVRALINNYTHEAGVRNLEREVANLSRKAAKELAMDKKKKKVIPAPGDLLKILGVPPYERSKIAQNAVGVATGLAWTEAGGETLTIEINRMKGKGMLSLTGKLGDIMKESAQAALSYIRSSSKKLKINDNIFKDSDFHIHVPEGAVPKDGPSAGIAMATALASAVTNRPVKKKIAMTGEVTLRGRVLPIGGLKEKVIAAYRDGIETVLFPEDNIKDLTDIPKDIQDKVKLIPVKHMDEVLKLSLEAKPVKDSN
jgi:ATP-dependent Lon protease